MHILNEQIPQDPARRSDGDASAPIHSPLAQHRNGGADQRASRVSSPTCRRLNNESGMVREWQAGEDRPQIQTVLRIRLRRPRHPGRLPRRFRRVHLPSEEPIGRGSHVLLSEGTREERSATGVPTSRRFGENTVLGGCFEIQEARDGRRGCHR